MWWLAEHMQWKAGSGMEEKSSGQMASSSICLQWFHTKLQAARVNERNCCQKEAFPKRGVTLLLSSYFLLRCFFFSCIWSTLNPGPCFSKVKLTVFIKRKEKRVSTLLYEEKMQILLKESTLPAGPWHPGNWF